MMHDDGPENPRAFQSDVAPEKASPLRPVSASGSRSHLNPDGTPDWEAIEFDVLCSRCGYNLRTLTRPRCTECGLDFAWPDVLDAAAHRSDFLFEHNWRTRPVRSLVTTVWRSLWPRSFWRQVSIHERVCAGPLWLLIILTPIGFWLIVLGFSSGLIAFTRFFLPPPGSPLWRILSPFQRWLIEITGPFYYFSFNWPSRPWWAWPLMLVMPLALLMAVIVVLSALRGTLARCRVRAVQMLRVVAYSIVPTAICCAFALLANYWVFRNISYYHFLKREPIAVCFGPLIVLLIATYYLKCGLKYYLCLPRAGIVAFGAVFIGWLILMNMMHLSYVYQLRFIHWIPPILPFA